MRCLIAGYREGPTHFTAAIANQEEQMLLQVVEQTRYELRIELERLRDLPKVQRPAAIPRQLPDHKISHRVMARRHERKMIAHVVIVPWY